MSRFQRMRELILPVTVLAVALASCSRPAAVKGSGASQVDQRSVPFHDSGETNSSASAPFQRQGEIPGAKAALPFRDIHAATLPAGTLLTVRLENPISADRNAVSGTFAAVVDEPVIVDGNVLVARGTGVSGRVETERSSLKGNRCCIRLTLDSIGISGKELPIQTSTLFAHSKGNDPHDSNSSSLPEVVRLKTGRRLTFRLAEATYVDSQEPASR
jgi:hypothetical protein